jgi:SagB-type dehydrogenase family enzyme
MEQPKNKTSNRAKIPFLAPIPILLIFVSLALNQTIYCNETKRIKLPAPKYKGKVSVEEAIYLRRSVRKYKDLPLSIEQVGQLLWSAGGVTIDGVTGPTRAYPSAGALYPIKIYSVVNNVIGLEKGVYFYIYDRHELQLVRRGNFVKELSEAAHGQWMISEAPVNIIFVGLYNRVITRYGERGKQRYLCMDVGHAGENLHLQCISLGLGTVVIGAFDDTRVSEVLGLPRDETPLYIMPVGVPAK